MIVPKFFIIEATGPGRVLLHNPTRVLPIGSRESHLEGRLCTATISSEARAWKDFFPVNFGELIVHAHVAHDMQQAGLSGIRLFPVEFACIESKSLAASQVPQYFWPQIHGGIDIDRSILWEHGSRTSMSESPFRAVPLPESWGGEDIFQPIVGVPFGKILCTRKVLNLAHHRHWDGLRFFPMDLPNPYRSGPSNRQPIEYLKKQWPPERWYPEGVEGHPNNLEEVDEV